MLLIVLMLSSLPTIRSRTCVDDVKGLCHAHDIFGWCYHDKVTGTFNCDDESFCANQTQLKGKVNSTGCFDRGADNIKCCCNEASMCNYNFIHVEPIVMMNTSQSCKYSYEKPDADIVHFKNCVDPWCIAFISANVEGGPSAVLRGCQSRILQKLTTDKKRTNPDPNTIIFYGMDELLRQPRCQEIVGADRPENGTQRACLDIFYMEKDLEKKGKICCCRGSDECNESIMWRDSAKTIESLRPPQISSAAQTVASLFIVLLAAVMRM